jgi:uncharacterized protein (TIGR03066 family)
MKPLYAIAAGLALFLPAFICADEPKEKDSPKPTEAKILGTWEITKASEEMLVGATVTFAKEGKLSITLKINGEEKKIDGKWELKDGKLITEAESGTADTDTFKKFTDDSMELENKDGQITHLKKKK